MLHSLFKIIFVAVILLLPGNVFATNSGDGVQTSFVVFGHVYVDYEALEESIDKVNNLKPDFVVFLGDTLPSHHQTEWGDVLDLTKKIEAKVYFVPGNHDVDDRASDRSDFVSRFGSLYKSFTVNNIDFIVLNTSNGAPSGNYDIQGNQVEWIKEVYKKSNNKKIVLMHHCLFASDGGKLCNNRGQLISPESNWNKILVPVIKNDTLAVFNGDVGSKQPYFSYSEDSLRYFGVGFSPDRLSSPQHFFYINVAGDVVDVRPIIIRDNLATVDSLDKVEPLPSFREQVGKFSYERLRILVVGHLKKISVALFVFSVLSGLVLLSVFYRNFKNKHEV